MKSIKVPYVHQININACGAAVLEMVYRYYGRDNFSQEELMTKYQELEPHGSGNFRLNTNSLAVDAREQGFNAGIGRAIYQSVPDVIALLKLMLDSGIPLIVCQRFTDEQPLIGHFRIVVGLDEEYVYLHDPSVEIGGENLKWQINKFVDFWQETGNNVTGGIFVFITQ
jgi:uncharacterized protein YvpB